MAFNAFTFVIQKRERYERGVMDQASGADLCLEAIGMIRGNSNRRGIIRRLSAVERELQRPLAIIIAGGIDGIDEGLDVFWKQRSASSTPISRLREFVQRAIFFLIKREHANGLGRFERIESVIGRRCSRQRQAQQRCQTSHHRAVPALSSGVGQTPVRENRFS